MSNNNFSADVLKDERVIFPYRRRSTDDESIEDAYNMYINLTYGIKTEFDVEDSLVSDIYIRLKCIYPHANNILLLKYLNASLFNITTKDVSEEKYVKRRKRLIERNGENGFM